MECRRLLLEAGADPTLLSSFGVNQWMDSVLSGSIVSTFCLDFVNSNSAC